MLQGLSGGKERVGVRRFQIREGDALTKLAEMEAGSVQTCVTSPPYFGLRDYGMDGQLGLEKTPEAYVAALVGVFREVRRVLSDDGTVWLNLGDSYAHNVNASDSTSNRSSTLGIRDGKPGRGVKQWNTPRGERSIPDGLKPKDLIGIPWMVAFALRAEGWYLRSDIIEEVELYCPCGCGYVLEERIWRHSQDREIIWKKPNPMPESVTDRPTKSHEYIFLLSKSAQYFYDAEAILEQAAWAYWGEQTIKKEQQGTVKWMTGRGQSEREENGTRNKRSVWTVATHSFPDAHFATFPPKLIEPCILAGSREGDTVLDPFAGAGTTGLVALRHNRHFIGIELNPSYCEMARRRVLNDAPLFNEQVA